MLNQSLARLAERWQEDNRPASFTELQLRAQMQVSAGRSVHHHLVTLRVAAPAASGVRADVATLAAATVFDGPARAQRTMLPLLAGPPIPSSLSLPGTT